MKNFKDWSELEKTQHTVKWLEMSFRALFDVLEEKIPDFRNEFVKKSRAIEREYFPEEVDAYFRNFKPITKELFEI